MGTYDILFLDTNGSAGEYTEYTKSLNNKIDNNKYGLYIICFGDNVYPHLSETITIDSIEVNKSIFSFNTYGGGSIGGRCDVTFPNDSTVKVTKTRGYTYGDILTRIVGYKF